MRPPTRHGSGPDGVPARTVASRTPVLRPASNQTSRPATRMARWAA